MIYKSNKPIRTHGLTLIELMVSVAIISVMVLAFGQILSNARKLVTGGQVAMRSNTAAAAMAGAFRQDIRRATPNGFMCINTLDTGNADQLQRFQPQLFMTIAGPVESINTNNQAANAGIVGFGVCNNDSTTPATLMIWRAAWLLNRQAGTPPVGSDTLGGNYDMADFQLYTRGQINSVVNTWLNDGGGNVVPKTMTVPPTDLTGLQKLWKCLAVNCTNVTIAWTDGTLNHDGTTMLWYSKDFPKDSNWRTRTAATATPTQPEYNANVDGGGNPASPALYRAMWTHENQTNWPAQVKIRFTLKDPQMPEEIKGGVDYEVICPIGR